MRFEAEVEQEEDGQWTAWIYEINGAMTGDLSARGATAEEALLAVFSKAKLLDDD